MCIKICAHGPSFITSDKKVKFSLCLSVCLLEGLLLDRLTLNFVERGSIGQERTCKCWCGSD